MIQPARGSALWQARAAQLLTIVRRELRGHLLRVRGLWIYPLAFAPPLVIGVHVLVHQECRLESDTLVLAGIVQFFYLRVALFFGAAALFARIFRGEMTERSLHYLLLAPVRRELILVGKFLGSVLASALVFGLAVAACVLFMFGHTPEGRELLANGNGLSQLVAYLSVTALACVGFGALFTIIGLVFKYPVLPTLIVLGMETWSGVLPPWWQRLTVTHYLKPLCPVSVPGEGWTALLTVVVEPTPTWLAVSGLLLFATLVVAAASWRVRRLEIDYTSD